jgi:transaldolase
MVKEARELSQIAPNIVIKIPLVKEGLKAVRELSRNNHE